MKLIKTSLETRVVNNRGHCTKNYIIFSPQKTGSLNEYSHMYGCHQIVIPGCFIKFKRNINQKLKMKVTHLVPFILIFLIIVSLFTVWVENSICYLAYSVCPGVKVVTSLAGCINYQSFQNHTKVYFLYWFLKGDGPSNGFGSNVERPHEVFLHNCHFPRWPPINSIMSLSRKLFIQEIRIWCLYLGFRVHGIIKSFRLFIKKYL